MRKGLASFTPSLGCRPNEKLHQGKRKIFQKFDGGLIAKMKTLSSHLTYYNYLIIHNAYFFIIKRSRMN